MGGMDAKISICHCCVSTRANTERFDTNSFEPYFNHMGPYDDSGTSDFIGCSFRVGKLKQL